MKALILWARMALAAWLLVTAGSTAAQERDPQGLWALRADDRVLFLIDLRRDPATEGGWTGEWIRPEHFSIHGAQTVSDVSGSIVHRRIRRASPTGDAVALDFEGGTPDAVPDTFDFRVVDPDAAELRFRDAPLPLPPMALARVAAGTAVASDWDAARTYALAQPARRSNPEMTALFEADQAARRGTIDWAVVEPQDRARRQRARQLLDAGALQSGDDYYHAAFVFQHGSEPNDYLLAHTLATVAIARGRPDATWIAAATLDRYLQTIGQKQIYGTQFRSVPGEPTTQEPYDRGLVSDALREALQVPSQARQERQRAEFEAAARARAANPR